MSLLILAACNPDPVAVSNEAITIRQSAALAGTTFTIEVVSLDEETAQRAIRAAFREVARLESVVSEWQADSEISAINAAPPWQAVAVSAELIGVINRALWFAELTDGAFDPSFAGCASLWSIEQQRIPLAGDLVECKRHTGFRNIQVDAMNALVVLAAPGLRIGLGGIGKGYRVDRAAEVLEAHGLTSYSVNGGGDIRVSAGDLHGPWLIEIDHPRADGQSLGRLFLDRGAIATSGDWSWYFDKDGVRYHHIFDPKTGQPSQASVAVTVIAETATDADAMATGLFVMGPQRGLELLHANPGFEALVVGQDLQLYRSAGFPELDKHPMGES